MNYLKLYRDIRRNSVPEDLLAMTKIGLRVAAEVKSGKSVDKPLFHEERPDYDSQISGQSSPYNGSTSRTQTSREASPSSRETSLEPESDEQDTKAMFGRKAGPESDGEDARAKSLSTKCLDLLLPLEFHNISYTVQHNHSRCRDCSFGRGEKVSHNSDEKQGKGKEKEINILQNISGLVRAGEIMAVVGASGSGKSTLIDSLAQKIPQDRLRGSITLNGEEVKNKSIIRHISAYVLQDDLLFPMLTVKETLMFAAELRLPKSTREKSSRVDEILAQLNLTKVADTLIGDEKNRGVSGGERRRVSIGKEIVHDPLLLFLDEPTSGLDSTNALLVVSTLLRIAATGSIIMISVHQPSERILKLITTLLFIADGQVIYRGSPAGIRDYFETYLGYSIPDGTNTIEYALDLVQDFSVNNETGISPLVHSFGTYSQQNSYPTDDSGCHEDILPSSTQKCDLESLQPTGVKGALAASFARGKLVGANDYLNRYNDSNVVVQKFANSMIYEIYVLSWRAVLNIRRTPALFITRFITMMICGSLLATVFWQLDFSPEGLRERLGFIAFATSTTYYICVDTLPIFLQERHIFTRETAHDSYRMSSYVLAVALVNIPLLLLLSFAFSMTTFWTVGLSGGFSGYVFFWMIVSASLWAGNSFATLLSATISNVIAGYTILVAALAYFLLLSGFFITRTRIPKYWLWLHYLSVIKYPYEAVLLNEFDRRDTPCFETGEQILSGTPFRGSANVADYILAQLRPMLQNTKYRDLNGSSCMIDGAAVLRSQNVGELSKWGCLAVTVSFGLFYRLLFYVILRVARKMNWRT